MFKNNHAHYLLSLAQIDVKSLIQKKCWVVLTQFWIKYGRVKLHF